VIAKQTELAPGWRKASVRFSLTHSCGDHGTYVKKKQGTSCKCPMPSTLTLCSTWG